MTQKRSEKVPEHQHPAELIREEMDERDWSLADLVLSMIFTGPVVVWSKIKAEEYKRTRLAMEMYLCMWPYEPNLVLGTLADDLSRAFGTSPDLWRNHEANWRKANGLAPLVAKETR